MVRTEEWPPRRYLTVAEAAIYVRRSEDAVRRLVHLKKIPHLKQGRSVRFDMHQLDEWMGAGLVPCLN